MSAGSANSNQKHTPKQLATYSVSQNQNILKSESSAGHLKFSEPSSSIGQHGGNIGNVPSSFQSSFAGLPKVNNQTQQSLQYQQEQLRQQLYGASVAHSIELASSGQKLPGATKITKKRIKSSGKLAGQNGPIGGTGVPVNPDESQYANLPTSSQQSFANVPSEHGHPLRASQNVMGSNHQRISSNPVVLKDLNQYVAAQGSQMQNDLRKGVQPGHSKQSSASFQGGAGMTKANQKRAMQTRERMGQILEGNQPQQVLGHAKYLGSGMHHQAQTVQASAGNNSLAQSTSGLNKAFSKVLNTLGDGTILSRQEAVNQQNMMAPDHQGIHQKGVKTAHANGSGGAGKVTANPGGKIKSFSGVTTSHHQKALSMQSYMMQPKQLSSTQQQQVGQKKVPGMQGSGTIGGMPSTAAGGSHQSTTGAKKKTMHSHQLSFTNDPHVINTMMAAPGTSHTQQRAELFSHANLPGTGSNLMGPSVGGSRTSHQNSMNHIGQKGNIKNFQKGQIPNMGGSQSGTGTVTSQFGSKLGQRGPKVQKQTLMQNNVIQQIGPKNSQTSPRTSVNISQSISPSQTQYKAANLKQPHHRHTNTAGGIGHMVSQKAALLHQQIMQQPGSQGAGASHRRQGTLDFPGSGQLTAAQGQQPGQFQKSNQSVAMTQKAGQPAAKKHDGPISAAAGDTSSVPASLANSSHYIRGPTTIATGVNTSMTKGGGSNSAVHSSGTHRRIKSDQVELLGSQHQYEGPIGQHGQAQSSQIVVINNNNTFQFQMDGTNINIHHNHPSNYNFSVENQNAHDIELSSAQMQELQQLQGVTQQQKQSNHYFKMGSNQDKAPQQSRKSMQKAKYERLMKGDRDPAEIAPLKSATQGKSYAQSKSILGPHSIGDGGQFAISQSIDVTGRGNLVKPATHLNSGRPPSTSAASAERQRQRHGLRGDEASAPRSNDASIARSKLKNQEGVNGSRVGSAKRSLHSRQKTIQRGTSGNSKKQGLGPNGATHVKAASHADGFFVASASKGNALYQNPGESSQKINKRKPSNSKHGAPGMQASLTAARKNQPQPNNGDKQGMLINSTERSARGERTMIQYQGQEQVQMKNGNYLIPAQGKGPSQQYQSSEHSYKQPNQYGSIGQQNVANGHYKQMSASNLQTSSEGSRQGTQAATGHGSQPNKMYMVRHKEQMTQQQNNYVNNQERPSAVTASQRTLMQHQHQLVANQANGTGPRAVGPQIQSHQGPISYVGKHKKVNSTAVVNSGQQKLYQILSNQNLEQKGPKIGQVPGNQHLQQISKTPEKLVMSAQALKNSAHGKLAPSQMVAMAQEPYLQGSSGTQPRALPGQQNYQQINSTGALQGQSSSQFLKKIKNNQVRRDGAEEGPVVVKQNLIGSQQLASDDQVVVSNQTAAYQQKLLAKNRVVQSDLLQRRAATGSQMSISRRSQQSNEGKQQIKKPVDQLKAWKTSDGELTPRKMIFNQIMQNIHQSNFVTKIDYYKIGKVIGKGAFGKVNLAIHRLTGKFVALKSINKTFMSDESSLKKVMQEYNILKRARHKNIVRLYESFETDAHIVYVMEVCGGGDLLTYVRRRRKLKEELAKFVFRQLIQGISYVNSKRVLHRDIKLDNILLTSEGDVKICDFGVSKLVQSATATQTEQCGTPAYIAPEVFKGRGYKGFQSDIWSAGVVLYAMLFGTVPFKATNMAELQKQIIKVDCSWGQAGEISAAALSLLQRILEVDPNKRLTPQQILSDPWMMMTEVQASQVEVFTDHEKKKIVNEFEYYNQKKELDEGNKQDDPFLEQMLQTTQNSVIKNNTTKSVILAPFNSTKSHISDNFYKADSIQEILVSQDALTFQDRCREVNRQYMLNNNAELDNGVYNEQEEKKKEEEQKQEEKKDDGLTGFDQQIDSAALPIIRDGEPNTDGTTTPAIVDSNMQSQLQSLNTSQQMVEPERVEYMEEMFGYRYNYVIEQLENDELNHATTTYFLLEAEKEF